VSRKPSHPLLPGKPTTVSLRTTLSERLPATRKPKEPLSELREGHAISIILHDDSAILLRGQGLSVDADERRVCVIGVLHELQKRGRIATDKELPQLTKNLGVDREGSFLCPSFGFPP
jgi:hypothetical protein